MTRRLPLLAATLAALLAACGAFSSREAPLGQPPAAGHVPGPGWERADPASLGWDEATLTSARELWEDNSGSSSVMVVDRGVVVAEWGDVAERRTVRSIRKSLISALIGTAVAEGALRLDATLAELGIDDRAPLMPEEKQATLDDLLTSRSGVYIPAARENSGHRRRRPPRGSHLPGTFFYYNNWDFNVLGTIYARHVEEDVAGAFARRIARPLQMEDFRPQDFEWRLEDISPFPAYDFVASTRDLARFGLLWARGGRWGDRQVVPAAWVAQTAEPVTPETFAGAGYGRLWWVQPPGADPAVPEGYVFAEGGSYLWVLPARDLVVVHHNRSDLMLLRARLGLLPREERILEVFRAIVAAAPAPHPAVGSGVAAPVSR